MRDPNHSKLCQCGRCGAPDPPAVADGVTLSPREAEVAMLVCDGLSDKEIARDLGIAITTVREFLVRVCKKTGIAATKTRRHTIRHWMATRHGYTGHY